MRYNTDFLYINPPWFSDCFDCSWRGLMKTCTVPGLDTECLTGNGITGWIGHTGQCSPFGPLFHFPWDILHPHPVVSSFITRRTLQSPLLQSIFGGCPFEFTRQLEAYPDDVSSVDHEKRTMLHAAAFVGMSLDTRSMVYKRHREIETRPI